MWKLFAMFTFYFDKHYNYKDISLKVSNKIDS